MALIAISTYMFFTVFSGSNKLLINETINNDLSQLSGETQTLEDGDFIKRLYKPQDDVYLNIPIGRPVGGRLSSNYGYRKDPFDGTRQAHLGIDFAAREGSKVMVLASGTVTFVGDGGGYGNLIMIEHPNGYKTIYGHLKGFKVKLGQKVHKYQIIGTVGSSGHSTGPHLHYEVWCKNKPQNPTMYQAVSTFKTHE